MQFGNREFESKVPPYSKRCEAAVVVLTGDLLNACGTAKGPRDVGYATGPVGPLRLMWANLAAKTKAPARERQDTLEYLRAARKAMMSVAWRIAFEGKPQEVRHEVALKLQHVQHRILALEAAQSGDIRDQFVESDQALRVGV